MTNHCDIKEKYTELIDKIELIQNDYYLNSILATEKKHIDVQLDIIKININELSSCQFINIDKISFIKQLIKTVYYDIKSLFNRNHITIFDEDF